MGKYLIWFILGILIPSWVAAETNGLVNLPHAYQALASDFEFNPQLLKLALSAYDCGVAAGDDNQPGILTIVDYQLPSAMKSLWVLDLNNDRILYHTWVAHGVGSGRLDATYFSNRPRSNTSSLGLYESGTDYNGAWGYAMHLYGLEPGFNDNAYRRHIVFHGGDYVSLWDIREYGFIGMSHGCFVVPKYDERAIIDTIRNGTLIFAYYPNYRWLHESKFLNCPILREMGYDQMLRDTLPKPKIHVAAYSRQSDHPVAHRNKH